MNGERATAARLTIAAVATLVGLTGAAAHADEPPTFADRSDDEVNDESRTFALLLDPLGATVGVYGGEGDFVVGRFVAVALEGAVYARGNGAATAVGAGALLYPLGRALHGLYLDPGVVVVRPLSAGWPSFDWGADAVGLSCVVGWQWTWDYGFSIRVGGGASYTLGGPQSGHGGAVALGATPVLDGSLGWAF